MTVAGTVLLVGVLVAATVAGGAWAAAGRGHRPVALERVGRAGLWGAVGGAATAAGIVLLGLVRHDESLAYVRKVSAPELPTYYRVTALWSALEGSLLLWLVVLGAVALGAMYRARGVRAGTHAAALATLCWLFAAFAAVSLLASPFALTEAQVAARPSPLLQDHVAMGLHPPLLYLGFAALAVPFALALGALATPGVGPARAVDTAWAGVVHRWTVLAWIALTAGVGLGAWWSYAVLGWGGYWAWDPVENASLLPWLTATALLHTVAPRTRGDRWRGWAVTLAALSFVLVLLATLLTRSGFVESVHAFTVSSLGPALLTVLLGAVVAWLVLAWRARPLDPGTGRAGDRPLSRGAVLRAHRVLLVLVAATLLVGTVLPSVLLVTTGTRLSVGAPWYERTLAPLALVVLALMALGPWTGGRNRPPELDRAMRVPAVVAGLALGLVGLLTGELWLTVVAGLAAFVAGSLAVSLTRRLRDRRRLGALVAHLGVAVIAVAVLAGELGGTAQQSLRVGETITSGRTTLTLVDLDRYDDGRRIVVEAELLLGQDGRFLGTLHPQLRWYEADMTMLAGPQIRSSLAGDVYVTLLDVEPVEQIATVRLTTTPLVPWLWGGGVLLVIGAAVTAWPARRRGRAGGAGGASGMVGASGADGTGTAHGVDGTGDVDPGARGDVPAHPAGASARSGTSARWAAVLAVVVALALAGCGSSGEPDLPRPAPALAGADLDGVHRDLAELEGSVVLVAAWASWCGPCWEEAPVLDRAQERWGADGLEVLGLNVRDVPRAAENFVARTGARFPSVVDPDGTVSVDWGVWGMPHHFLVDRTGAVVAHRAGPVTDEWLESVIPAQVQP